MQIIDTFSGIGGFSYAGSLLGWRTVQFCEMNEFCNKILGYYWPGVPIHTDIKTLTAEQIINNGLYDKDETTILTGGVPCQPWSLAGKRRGEEDDRNLWPQTIKLIGSLQPDYAVLENVFGFLTWNKGIFLEQMLTSLETEGYEVFPVVLPACGVNAPHRRDRVWFIAYSNRNGYKPGRLGQNRSAKIEGISEQEQRERIWSDDRGVSEPGVITYSNGSIGHKRRMHKVESEETERHSGTRNARNHQRQTWDNFPTQSPLCSRDDGLSTRIYDETIYTENDMDRDYVITNALNKGKIEVDFSTGKIYSRQIRGSEGEKIELPGAICNGYIVHNISFEGIKKSCRAHQIVWIAANGVYDREKYMIDHINRNKSKNELSNLRLATSSENRRNCDDYTGQFTDEEKAMIFTTYNESNMSIRELAEEFDISKSRIHQIIQEQRLIGITFPKWRNESIKGYGNAIVPQVAYQIFKAIEEFVLNENKV